MIGLKKTYWNTCRSLVSWLKETVESEAINYQQALYLYETDEKRNAVKSLAKREDEMTDDDISHVDTTMLATLEVYCFQIGELS